MLHPLDEHPIHQTSEPLSHLAHGDRNFYDRFFFNGYSREGDVFFALALGVYPNRRIMDASFSVVREGCQHVLHASRQADERGELQVGPISVAIVEPMRTLQIRVAANDFGLEAEARFRARTVALEEPRFIRRQEGRLVMDSTRYTQFGTWSGRLRVADARLRLEPQHHLGCRDRSWGVRPLGEREAAPPGPLPQFFWLWAPLHFDDVCTHFDVNEDAEGLRWHENGAIVPVLPAPDAPTLDGGESLRRAARVEHRIRWAPGTRRAESVELSFFSTEGERTTLALEPLLTFQMLGLGYLHPEWGHGMWKGPHVVDGERWQLKDLAPMDPRHLHVQQLVRARMGEREGIGVLEQLVIGPHTPSGFRELLDPAP